MKMNWIKGLDRVAILLAIPIAIFGWKYSSKKYAESKAVSVYTTYEEDLKIKQLEKEDAENAEFPIFGTIVLLGWPDKKGVFAEGHKGLAQHIEEYPMSKGPLQRAIEKGGDPSGTLVENKRFGLKNLLDDEMSLLPRPSKRYLSGAIGSLIFISLLFLGVSISTRVIPRIIIWVIAGFNS
ncbi:MAG: hypothetical protein K1000chlam3_01478 [Chlamydiae bacterium]|nr:hypothetical protein [Chlamydiota bacterium]